MENEENINPTKEISLQKETIKSEELSENDKNTTIPEENQNNGNEDSLSYTTQLRDSQKSFNKGMKDIQLSMKRRLSYLSTSPSKSDTNYQELSGYSSEKKIFSKNSFQSIEPVNLFGNSMNNLVRKYY